MYVTYGLSGNLLGQDFGIFQKAASATACSNSCVAEQEKDASTIDILVQPARPSFSRSSTISSAAGSGREEVAA